MATGVHSRLQTGRTNPKTPQAPWYLELPRRAWTALTPRKRLALLGGLLVMVSGIVLLGQARAANAPRELYIFALAPVELRDVARELSLMGISHELNAEQDNLLVAPADRERALQHLRHCGLPRARAELVEAPPGAFEQPSEEERQARLQERLRVDLRQFPGVADASVQLALPPGDYFPGDHAPPTACVKVEMQLGQTLNRSQVDGMVAVVAASVSNLKPENVTVVDQHGRVLTASAADAEHELLGSLQASLELSLNQRAQSLLDRCLGPGHAFTSVTVELDTSEIEIRKQDVGGPEHYVVLQSRKESEEYGTSSDEEEAAQLTTGRDGRSYRKIGEITKRAHDINYFVKVDRMPRIARLSCAVALDRESQAAQVRELVKGAIGLDETRGDFLTVQAVTAPLTPAVVAPEAESPSVAASPAPQLSLASLAAGFLLAGLVALTASAVGGWRPRSQVGRFRLGMESREGPRGIQELRQTQVSHETSIRQTRRVEELVRAVPNRAAATLKELWLQ